MGLLTQKTDLKSLKYGSDRFDGGSSGQPFVKTPIAPSVQGGLSPTFPFGPESLIGQTGGVDQLVRGGFLLPTKLSDDVQRISKFLVTGQGLQFLAKQQGLYIAEQISLYGLDIKKWNKIYNPLSPIVNTTLAPTGEHLANIILRKGGASGINEGEGYLLGFPNTDILRDKIYKEGKTYLLDKNKKAASKDDRADGITIRSLYLSSSVDTTLKDTVDFRIVKIDNSGEGNNTYIHFRSYIEGLSDSYTADWGTTKYMGRGENFYFYNGFDRTISFNFKVPILSKYEQQSVYTKLNYLASLCAPDYSSKGGINQGFMRGNLIKLTIGDYLVDVPGIFQGLTYTINDDAGWDIARNSEGKKLNGSAGLNDNEADTAGWVMPRLIEVSGFTFKPIHTFIPKTVNINSIDQGGQLVDAPFINFGKVDSSATNGFGYGTKINNINASQNNTNTIGGTTA
jgi:hypothetical protein